MERNIDILRILASEFYPDEPRNEVVDRYRKLLDKEFTPPQTCAKLQVTRDANDNITGFLLTKFYTWETIQNQIFIGVKTLDAKPHLFLAPLSNLIQGLIKEQSGDKPKIESVAELAFYWIDEASRGKGLGSIFFNNFINQATQPLGGGNCLIFTTARAKKEMAKQGSDIFEYLLEQEKKRNGVSPQKDKVNITGVLVEFQQIVRDLSLGVSDIDLLTETHEGARATDHLVEKNMMKLLGYSRKMGKVYAKVPSRGL